MWGWGNLGNVLWNNYTSVDPKYESKDSREALAEP